MSETTQTPPPSQTSLPADAENYTSESIQVLEGLEAIRKRPGMYVGGTGLNALHHLVYECVDNAIDEVMAGYATTVTVRVGVDGSCTVIDDGRGMPVDPMKHENPTINGRPAVEVILTEVHAGGKFGDNAYKVSGGLHGVGVKCVNALSEWTEVEVFKNERTYHIGFSRGEVTKPLELVETLAKSAATEKRTGTRISFLPDPQIFPDTEFRFDTLESRLRELAYLNPGVRIRLVDERVDASGERRDVSFYSPDGIGGYVAWRNEQKTIQSPVISFSAEDAALSLRLDFAMQYVDSSQELTLAFGNNIPNRDGGTHVQGFKAALTRVVNGYARKNNLLKDLVPSGDDLREGLVTVVSVKLPNPQFNNQTKEKLLNPEIEGFVSNAIGEKLGAWLEEHPREARDICMRAVLAAQAREAARKARELIKRKGALDSGGMPHKLSDCSSDDVEKTELFIVEGDSAGGSAKGGRDHVHQAILPLRGKLLNVEKARLDKVLGFEEIRILIQALQCGIGEDFDISKLRYGRIIIMTDADVDGSHIRTLLLTFLFRQMPELVRQGKIFIAQPPLYQISRGKQSTYVLNDKRMNETLVDLALGHAVFAVRDQSGAVVHRVAGDEIRRMVRALDRLDELVTVSQRRGIQFAKLLAMRANDPAGKGHLPMWHLAWPEGDLLFFGEAEARAALAQKDLVLDDLVTTELKVDRRRIASLRELHENREIERIIGQLAQWHIDIADWDRVQVETVTGDKEPTRYAWLVENAKGSRGEAKAESKPEPTDGDAEGDKPASRETGVVEAASVPGIVRALLEVGRRGIEVKRFKGLGEMEAEQLWETTMDQARRTLVRVTLESASEADTLFTLLMGEDVERRRAYIEKHALEVKNLDI
ncbi:MAG: DNA gyrase subunit B [Planctomycetaceae bacterium]|nr:DNA gyrase subunit B [Planctomycetaceae bacterium]